MFTEKQIHINSHGTCNQSNTNLSR